jgi:ADP-heptose:LPS heptosyltransferase
MKFIKVQKEGLIMERNSPWEKELKVNKRYLVSDLVHQQLSYIMPDHISKKVTSLKDVYKKYQGEDLNGKTLLVWRHGGIGDLMFMMPPLRILKVVYPDCKIIVAIGGKYIDLYRHVPYIDEIHQLPFDIETLDRADYHLHFEQIIEGNPKAERVNAYDLFLERFGFKPDEIPAADKVPDIFLTSKEQKWASEFLEAFKVEKDSLLVGIQIAASSPIRTFPDSKVLAITNLVAREEKGRVVLFGSGAQIELAQGIKQSLPHEYHHKVAVSAEEGFTLRQSMAITQHCDLIVAPDSAMIHIAGALRVPVLGLYGPFPADLRMRYYYNALALNAGPSCSPCFVHDHDPCPKGSPSPCFSLIDVHQIMFAMQFLLEQTGDKSLSDVKTLQKSIFNQVIDQAKKYMTGKGLDLGCGYQKYDSEFDIIKIDANPMVNPDVIGNFLAPSFEIDEDINYIISSYSINTTKELNILMMTADEILKINGHIILYIGDKDIIKKATKRDLKSNFLLDYLKSDLNHDTLTEEMKNFENFELVEEGISTYNDEEEAMRIFDSRYGIFQVWRKINENKREETPEKDGTEVPGIKESE